LVYYSGLDRSRQYAYGSEIVTDIERYRSLLTILIINAEEEIAREKADEFDRFQQMFEHFYAPSESQEPTPEELPQDRDLLDTQAQDTQTLELEAQDINGM